MDIETEDLGSHGQGDHFTYICLQSLEPIAVVEIQEDSALYGLHITLSIKYLEVVFVPMDFFKALFSENSLCNLFLTLCFDNPCILARVQCSWKGHLLKRRLYKNVIDNLIAGHNHI